MSITVNGKSFYSNVDFIKQGRGCATIRPNNYQIRRNDERIATFRVAQRPSHINILINFIHITDGGHGLITSEQRYDQVAELNRNFKPIGIEFFYNEENVVYHENSSWYRMDHGSREEKECKSFLQKDPYKSLNFYTAGLGNGLLGWATFPWELSGDPQKDGVVMLDQTLPGGDAVPFNLGRTATHEIGHWLGLYHTFQGGCDAYGDHVTDTHAHSEPNSGTPEDGLPHNACNHGEFAPIHNYMNYVDDVWMTEFTNAQKIRIWDHIVAYRNDLIP